MRISYLLLISILFVISSCYYDNREELYPYLNDNCDTINITFNSSVLPILESSCLGCHSNNSASVSGANIFLENYSDVQTYGDNGDLFGAVNHEPGYSAMPKNSGKIDNCSIDIIRIWIELGFPEN